MGVGGVGGGWVVFQMGGFSFKSAGGGVRPMGGLMGGGGAKKNRNMGGAPLPMPHHHHHHYGKPCLPWVFSALFIMHKLHQIAKSITHLSTI